ncbi:MAG TPA: hypothetical protein VFW45_14310 [Candidatus Polarisedimenticolia bacterium]|nr:hypothetical protein [Candidatus Polarisedimenticolia bacterium]
MTSQPAPAGAHPLLDRVLDPATPRPLRLAAARGALPLPRQDLIVALVQLCTDLDAEISTESRKTLAATPADVLDVILRDPSTPVPVLEHFGYEIQTPPALLSSLIANPSAPDDLLLRLAESSHAAVLDQIVRNEIRLASNPEIVVRLKANPALSRESRRRIVELEEHVLGTGASTYILPTRAPADEAHPAEALPEIDAGLAEAAAPMLEVPLTPEEQAAEDALRHTPLFQRIVRMSVAEKIQAAVKGNSEERAILVRDPSRLVAATVLKSPKLSDQEIESFANLRNVHDEVLRIIGNHREWTKSYGVALALARNPRSPTGISLTMLNRLVNRDLKNLSNDKNIPEVIRRSSKRLYELRTQPQKLGKKK